uniref:Uncharacterized protein n=1 Tax=Sus scrofa TaxID=9823 RepID=A0A8D0Z3T1_PIG
LANQIQQSINRLAGGIPPPFKGGGKAISYTQEAGIKSRDTGRKHITKTGELCNVKQIRFFDALYDILEKGSRLFPALPYVSHQKPRPVL